MNIKHFAGAWRPAAIVCAAMAIGSCGGESGNPVTPTPPPVTNSPPVISTANQDISVVENGSGVLFTVAASDANGDTLQYSLFGDDFAKFAIDASGQVTFKASPDHELPTDADANNTYTFTVMVSDGRAADTVTASVRVTNDREGIKVTRIMTGLGNDPLIASHASKALLYVTKRDGTILEIDGATGAAVDRGQVYSAGETGRIAALGYLNGFVVALLDIPGRGLLGRSIPTPDARYNYRDEFLFAGPTDQSPSAVFYRHNVLYLAVGDPAGNFAQDAGSGLGKLFKVNVAGCGASTLSYCIGGTVIGDGIHNLSGGGRLGTQSFLFDRGLEIEEEINFYNPEARPLDFGWPGREGTEARQASAPAAINGPSIVYPRGDGFREGSGIVGGTPYDGPIKQLDGKLIFADISGKIFATPSSFLSDGFLHRENEIEQRTADFQPDVGAIDRPIAVLTDDAGVLYILDADGELFRVDPA